MDWLFTNQPGAVAVAIGPWNIYWYGIIIVTALVAGLGVSIFRARQKQVSTHHVYNLFLLLLPTGLIGGRIAHVIAEWPYYISQPVSILRIWEGGLAFHGVLIACLITAAVYCHRQHLSFWRMTDVMVVGVPLMQAIGRWGNYFNQELYGPPTDLPWGIPISITNRLGEFIEATHFHPIFLYESLAMVAVFGMLWYVSRRYDWRPGMLTLVYFFLFGIVRFALDFFRIDHPQIGPLLVTQWISIIVIISAGYSFLYRLLAKHP